MKEWLPEILIGFSSWATGMGFQAWINRRKLRAEVRKEEVSAQSDVFDFYKDVAGDYAQYMEGLSKRVIGLENQLIETQSEIAKLKIELETAKTLNRTLMKENEGLKLKIKQLEKHTS